MSFITAYLPVSSPKRAQVSAGAQLETMPQVWVMACLEMEPCFAALALVRQPFGQQVGNGFVDVLLARLREGVDLLHQFAVELDGKGD